MVLGKSHKERLVNTWLHQWGEKAAQSHPAPGTLGKFSPVGEQETELIGTRQKHQTLGGLETAAHTPLTPPTKAAAPNGLRPVTAEDP